MNFPFRMIFFSLFLLSLTCASIADAEDYVRLKTGEIVKCAVLRQDTLAVYTTGWESRRNYQPALQVYSRDEVESVWFGRPPEAAKRVPYVPRAMGWQFGGSFSLETVAETDWPRTYAGIVSLSGGFDILKELGLETEVDFLFPYGDEGTAWRSYPTGYRAVMNVAAHPVVWKGIVPFAVIGGGAMFGRPLGNVFTVTSHTPRSLLNMGLGVKCGNNGIGYRIEWRHNIYDWQVQKPVPLGYRWFKYQGDLSSIRGTIFLYF